MIGRVCAELSRACPFEIGEIRSPVEVDNRVDPNPVDLDLRSVGSFLRDPAAPARGFSAC